MDILIGRVDKKKIKTEKVDVKKIVKVDPKLVNKALEDLTVFLTLLYKNKPSVELYDAKVHLEQLRRSIVSAKI